VKRDVGSLLGIFPPSPRPPVEQIHAALARLSERERAVLELRYGLVEGRSVSLQAAGQRLGVTGERVRQLELRAIGKLRRLARAALRQ
jgi:RNA polymerase primary sigma factor